jgi:hypothetical protein
MSDLEVKQTSQFGPECLLFDPKRTSERAFAYPSKRGRLSAAALLMNEDMPKASSNSLGVFVPSAGAAFSQTDAFLPVLWLGGVTQNLIMLFPR